MEEIKGGGNEYIVVKAISGGVQIIGLTRGTDTKSHHIELLDAGEVLIAQFTDNTSAIKIKGTAEIYTKHGVLSSEKIPKTTVKPE
jgi:transcription attenuation protein (tryptophan RNA-binding attenuator protein)